MTRVLSVGQCGFDHATLVRSLRTKFGAEVVAASTFPEAVSALSAGDYALVLVNRVTDADGTSGLDLIRTMKDDPALASVPVMLVSNYPSAQQEARALGALPGFGKSDLDRPAATETLRPVLSPQTVGGD